MTSDSTNLQTKIDAAEVKAAGGIIVRDGKIALVHRPHYDDWTLPKGKLDAGETFEQAALREIQEETGMTVELAEELPPTFYIDHQDRQKVVRYWIMPHLSGDFTKNEEVDELVWVRPEKAAGYLTYVTDQAVIHAAISSQLLG